MRAFCVNLLFIVFGYNSLAIFQTNMTVEFKLWSGLKITTLAWKWHLFLLDISLHQLGWFSLIFLSAWKSFWKRNFLRVLFLQLHWLRYYEVAAKSQFVDSLLQEKNLNNFIFTKYLVLHVSAQVTLLLNQIADTDKRRMVDLEWISEWRGSGACLDLQTRKSAPIGPRLREQDRQEVWLRSSHSLI